MDPYVQNILYHLYDRVTSLENELNEFKKEFQAIKPITIENINVDYKIQELDIKELSGTLLVGLSAQGKGEEIEEYVKDMVEKKRSMHMKMGDDEEEEENMEEDN